MSKEEKVSIDNLIDIKKYGDMLRLLRVTSYVMRFVSNLKKKLKKEEMCRRSCPTGAEMKAAHDVWIRANQSTLKNYDQIMMQLNCKNGSDGIVRCEGRMKNASLVPESTRAPILLSKVHRF